jgi:Uma2 family endonuclease
MKAVQPRISYSELRTMPSDGKRYELVNGEVFVAPAPNEKHQRIVRNLLVSMQTHARTNRLGRAYCAPFDVVFGERTALEPDILFVSAARRGIIGPEYIVGAPDLVVEVLSPSSRAMDRVTKFEQYALHGVSEYWVIDPDDEHVEVYLLKGKRYLLKGRFAGHDALESSHLSGWKLAVHELFAE